MHRQQIGAGRSLPFGRGIARGKGAWLTAEDAKAIVTRTVDILLNRNRVGHSERGLLEEVHNRYRENDQEDVFCQVIGDGTLWVVLLAVMTQLTWEKGFERFERAINLYRVYGCDVLRADTSIGKLTTLVTRLDVEKARELIAEEAPRIAETIKSIERTLTETWEQCLKEQVSPNHQSGDLIWHPEAGWGIVEDICSPSSMSAYLHLRGEIRKVARKGFFVNLRLAADNSAELKQQLDAIMCDAAGGIGDAGVLEKAKVFIERNYHKN